MASTEPPGEVPGVNVSGSQGIQSGSGNVQFNAWPQRQSLDPVALSALNPHTAVARLQQLPHDQLVDFFAKASPDDVGEILEVFLYADLAKLVTALADINRRKATELITAIGSNLIDQLPEAAEAIAREAARLGWAYAGLVDAYVEGYARKCKNGRIFWSATFGMRTTVGAIDDCVTDDDDHIPWGFPTGDQETAVPSPFRTKGFRQQFQIGLVYSSERGTFLVSEDKFHEDGGGSGGWLGFPIGEVEDIPGHRVQIFEGGAIYAHRLRSGDHPLRIIFTVRREVLSILPDTGVWRPTSKETPTASASGVQGTVQGFELKGRHGATYQTAIYSAEQIRVLVAPRIWSYYSDMGAEKSWLGFPVLQQREFSIPDHAAQGFEGGSVYWRGGTDPIAVPAEIIQLGQQLGWPVTEEYPVGADGAGRIQYFEKGVVTMRDGKYEVWLRPDSSSESPERLSARAERAKEAKELGRTPGLQLSQREPVPPPASRPSEQY
jgi:hypothetical protein